MMTLRSAIVPCYNDRSALTQCNERVLAIQNDDRALDVIIFDDRSRNGSLDLAKGLVQQHSQITLLCPPINEGKGGGHRIRPAAAKCDFLAFQDVDLESDPQGFKRMLVLFKQRRSRCSIWKPVFSRHKVAIARASIRNPNVQFHCVDSLELNSDLGTGGFGICLLVLEHLNNPEILVQQIRRSGTRRAILSVAKEPSFRIGSLCRALYWRHLANHLEPVQAFWKKGFLRILSDHFSDVRIKTSLPWLLGFCRP